MGLFDFFKKKEELHYDSTNIKVTDLENNYILEYNLKTWAVEKMYEYDWGDQFFTREFIISEGKDTKYLHIEQARELEIALTETISVRELDVAIPSKIKKKGKPPKEIHYNNEIYYRDSENIGYRRNVEGEDWKELVMWLYLDKTEEKLINIEQWGEEEFDAKIGEYLDENEISNILPTN